MTITRSTISTAPAVAVAAATHMSPSKAQAIAALKKFIAEQNPGTKPETLLAEDTKFGIMDKLLFEKSKPDKHGIYSNVKLIQRSYNSMKELVFAVRAHPTTFEGVATVAYKPINDNYHYILVRKLNINKDNIEKYLLLL